VLNQLAGLSMMMDQKKSQVFKEGFKSVTAYLRQMIIGLRPAMLNYGLALALDELVDDLTARANNNIDLQIEANSPDVRYDQMIEAHLYRIVQQACENALRHAQASSIRIRCKCDLEGVHLVVEDDGVGFSGSDQLDLNQLLTNKHFGIAGMFERAEIIGAELDFDSKPGIGTKVRVTWHPIH
jgi:two-component system sensor histidine kinase DegS